MLSIEDIKLTGTPYEIEYNEVISIMGGVCRTIIWNNNPVNQDRRMRIDEQDLIELAPRIWALSVDYEKISEAEKQKCFL